jgi:subtilase family serine protease
VARRILTLSLTAAAVLGMSGVAGARPDIIRLAHRFAGPPTGRQCMRAFGAPCYRPGQLQVAYDLRRLYRRGLDGRGRTIVIVDSFGSPTIRHDLAVFDRAFHLPDPQLQIDQPVGAPPPFNPGNSDMEGWAGETSLDVEYAHALAPGANILLVETPVDETEGIAGFPQIVAAENDVIDSGVGDVISQSFSATEQTFPNAGSIFALRGAYVNAAAHGVTVLAATGDTGATSLTLRLGLYPFPVTAWPATDPLVTGVGGTRLFLDSAGRRLAPDEVWNQTTLRSGPAAGGGGSSAVFGRPAFQNRVRRIVGRRRGTPDVSMSAAFSGAALVYTSFPEPGGPGWYPVGGTSEATPLFAAVVAIADQAAHRRLGWLNPALYALAARRGGGIVDITRGDNTVRFRRRGRIVTVHGYRAVRGYDLASGLGTVDGARLVAELAGR